MSHLAANPVYVISNSKFKVSYLPLLNFSCQFWPESSLGKFFLTKIFMYYR